MIWITCTLTSTSQAPGQGGSLAHKVVWQNWWKETRWQEQPWRRKGAPRRTHGWNHAKGNWPRHSVIETICLLTYTVVIQMGRKHSPKTAWWTKSPTMAEPDPPPSNQEQTWVKVNSMRTGSSRSGLVSLSHMSPWYLGTNQKLVLYMQRQV